MVLARPVRVPDNPGAEVSGEVAQRQAADADEFTLGQVEGQAQTPALGLEVGKGRANRHSIASDDAVIQIENCQIQVGAELLGKAVDGCCKQQWAKGITLLDPPGGLDGGRSKPQE